MAESIMCILATVGSNAIEHDRVGASNECGLWKLDTNLGGRRFQDDGNAGGNVMSALYTSSVIPDPLSKTEFRSFARNPFS